jgi:type III pantothenate kinase
MTPDVVVDIGNTRMKWGWVPAGQPMQMASLPADDPSAWEQQLASLPVTGPLSWTVASVHPLRTTRFVAWIAGRGDRAVVIKHTHIPLTVDVEEPEKVGIDRLLSALAAHHLADPQSAIVLSVGTAVTADVVEDTGVFRGGVIFPGPQLMAESLHRWTAQLPLVEAREVPSEHPPARNTRGAILAGIRYAIVGAAYLLVDRYCHRCNSSPWVFMTGGALGDLAGTDFGDPFMGTRTIPTLTLEGIRIAAEGLP